MGLRTLTVGGVLGHGTLYTNNTYSRSGPMTSLGSISVTLTVGVVLGPGARYTKSRGGPRTRDTLQLVYDYDTLYSQLFLLRLLT